MRFPFDSISFARAGHALRPQPSYPRAGTNSPLPVPHTPGDLAPISGSKQPASVLDPMRKTGDGGYSLRRRRALALPLARHRKRRRVMSREPRACQWIRAPRPSLTAGDLHQRPGSASARALVPNAAVRSGGAIGVGRAAAAWQQAAKRRAAPNLHLVGGSRGRCSPAARHGLGIRHELGSDAASGRIGRH